MKFDLEAAKRGEPVEYRYSNHDEWIDVHFVGTRKNGMLVIEQGCTIITGVPETLLRMKPQSRVRWVQPCITAGEPDITSPCNTPEQARHYANGSTIVGDPIRIEFPPEDEA